MSESHDREIEEFNPETKETVNAKKLLVRRKIEEAVELKRLREEFGEFDGLD